MITSTLRIVGGSVMMAIPKPVLEGLGLSANEKVNLRIDGGCLVIERRQKPRYSLDELMAQCDLTASATDEVYDWDRAEPFGREVI
jgi:antitoxin ChpS